MNQLGFPLLSIVLFLPLAGSVVTLFLGRKRRVIKIWALTVTLADRAKSEVKVVVSSAEKIGVGENIWLHFAPEIIHLFDQDTPILQRTGG